MPQIYLNFFCKFGFKFNFVIVSQYVRLLPSAFFEELWHGEWMNCEGDVLPLSTLFIYYVSFFLVSNTSLRQPTCLYMRCKKNNCRWLGKYFIHASASPPPVFWPLENDAVWQKNTHIWINVLTVEPSRPVLVYLLFSGNPRPQLRTILAFFLTSIIIIAWKKTSKARDVISLDLQI